MKPLVNMSKVEAVKVSAGRGFQSAGLKPLTREVREQRLSGGVCWGTGSKAMEAFVGEDEDFVAQDQKPAEADQAGTKCCQGFLWVMSSTLY